jgi:hypothetical protein
MRTCFQDVTGEICGFGAWCDTGFRVFAGGVNLDVDVEPAED